MIKHKNAAHIKMTRTDSHISAHTHTHIVLINVNALKHAGNYSFYDDRTMANGAYTQRSRELPKWL